MTTDSKHNEPVALNILDRKFIVSVPNTAWVSDITHVRVGFKWSDECVFIGMCSRSAGGWDLSKSLDQSINDACFAKGIVEKASKSSPARS